MRYTNRACSTHPDSITSASKQICIDVHSWVRIEVQKAAVRDLCRSERHRGLHTHLYLVVTDQRQHALVKRNGTLTLSVYKLLPNETLARTCISSYASCYDRSVSGRNKHVAR